MFNRLKREISMEVEMINLNQYHKRLSLKLKALPKIDE
jgi:hypothetical protein